MLLQWVLPLYAFFISYSSIVLGTSLHIPSLILVTISLVTMIAFRSNHRYFLLLQLLLVGALHWLSQIDWCSILYLFLVGRHLYHNRSLHDKLFVSLYAVMYAFISIINHITNPDFQFGDILETIFFTSLFGVAVILSPRIVVVEKQIEIATEEKNWLARYDALTGLINFEESHRALSKYVGEGRRLAVVLIDCTDLTSLNLTEGYQGGNRVLQQMAALLQTTFTESLMIARYGGDEFLIALEMTEDDRMIDFIIQQLDAEFPKLMGIQITYGIARSGEDGWTKDDLLLVAEKKLHDRKREIFLKREEHLLRSEKLRVVGELASGMAHEIRNPLTTIKGFLQLSKANGYYMQNWYDLIMLEIQRMSELTGEFLQFSKPHVADFKPQNLQDIIQRVVFLMESEATRLGHRLVISLELEPITVLMDGDKMVQLLLNLVKNAIEAMKQDGSVSIHLKANKTHTTIEVSDTGPGIEEEELDKIFHPFYTTKESGTGLGLSICHKIVQDHNGFMEVHSKLNEGTTFVITLPLAKTKEAHPVGSVSR